MQFFVSSKNVFIKKKLGSIIYDINLRGIPEDYLKTKKTSPDYIYVTTEAHFNELLKDLEEKGYKGVLGHVDERSIVSNPLFPKDIGGVWRGSLEERLGDKVKNEKVSIAIINGMGTGYGDSIVGLRALEIFKERLREWFDDVKIDLYQRYMIKNFNLYLRNSAVSGFYMLPITLEKILEYDFIIDLSNFIYKPELQKWPLIDFFLEYMGIDKDSISPEEKRNKVQIDEIAKLDIEDEIRKLKENKLLLFHPLTSTPIRTIPEVKSIEILKTLIEQTDYTVVSTVPIDFKHERYKNISHLSKTLEHFIYIVSQMDAIVTAETVTFHVSDSFNIPTVLLATSIYGKLGATYYPSVKTILLGEDLKNNPIINLHKSRNKKDIEFAQLLWKAFKTEELIKALKEITQKDIPKNVNVQVKSKYEDLVSVIIPTYNREKYIKDTLITVLGQTHKNLEIIVVDDGSTDNTTEIVNKIAKKDSRVRYIYQENKGATAAKNTGIKNSNGSYIQFLDSDDLLFSFSIERKLDFLKEFPDIQAVYTDIILYDSKNFYYRTFPKTPKKPVLFFFLLITYPIVGTSTLVERSAILDVGMFDEEIDYAEDYDLTLRFIKKYNIDLLRIPSVIYRKHQDGQMSKNDKKIQKFMDISAYRFVSSLDIENLFKDMSKKQLESYIDSVVKQILRRKKPLLRTSIYLLEFNQKLDYSKEREELIKQLKERLEKEEIKIT